MSQPQPLAVGTIVPLQRDYKSANYTPLTTYPPGDPEEVFKRAWNLLAAKPGGDSLVMMQLSETSVRFWKSDRFDVYVDCVTSPNITPNDAATALGQTTADIDRVAEYIFPAFVRDEMPQVAAHKAFEYANAFVSEKKGRA